MNNANSLIFRGMLLNKNLENITNLIKSTRLQRPLIPLSLMLIPAAFANSINADLIILGICCLLIYASGGILNAKIDGDFQLKYDSFIIYGLILIAIISSFTNPIIFFSVVVWIGLSYIYSKYSRHIVFGDSIILSLTHAAVPIFSASLLVGLEMSFALKLSAFMFIAFFNIVPMKNLNGIEADKKRKYKTLMTEYKLGKSYTKIFLEIYFIIFLAAYFLFDLDKKFLIAFGLLLAFKILMTFFFDTGKEVLSYNLVRLLVIGSSAAFVYSLSPIKEIFFLSSAYIAAYLLYLFIKYRKQGATIYETV